MSLGIDKSEAIPLNSVQSTASETPLSPWEGLPPQIFFRLYKKFDGETIRTLRLVCSAWKTALDQGVGLKVKVDDRILGNKEFAQTIKISEARILHMDDSQATRDFTAYPGSLIKLILTGFTSPKWFVSQIPKFEGLTKLVIRGGFLTPCVLEDNGTLNPNVILLPSLKSLEIVVNEFAYPFYLPLTIRLRDPERAAENDRNFNEMTMKVGKNICFLLDTLRCPKLRMVQMYSYQKVSFLLPSAINWRSGPLERFLEYHKDSLRELYLPDFEGKHSWDNEERHYPVTLSKLSVMLSQFIGDREDSRQQDLSYWKTLISEQRCLKSIDVQTYDIIPEWFLEVLSSLCTHSKTFLTFVDFTNQTEDHFVLDCELFADCKSLEVLKFACRETEAVVVNLSKLPACIKKLRMHSCFVQPPPPNEMSKFKQLKMLEIDSLIADEMPHEAALLAVKAILKIRSLNYVGITFDQTVGESEEFRRTIENFSLYWDPRFRYTSIKINFEHELLEGWSDDVFDELRNDRDTMGYREPEDLSSWQSSVSGFVEDDPRVMIFHHIPMLVGEEDFIIGGFVDDDDDDISERLEDGTSDTSGFIADYDHEALHDDDDDDDIM